MKTLLMCSILGLGTGLAVAQKVKESDVPKPVKSAFAKAYPAVKGIEWEKEDGSYEASFDQNKAELSVTLDAEGNIKEVETEIKQSELPSAVKTILIKDYAGYKVTEAAKIVAAGTTTYEAEVKKGKESFDLIFDPNGKLLEKNAKGKEHDKD